MLILGLNAFHADASACLLEDGRLVGAIEEERLRRVKHWAGLPVESVRWCLERAGARLDDVDHVALNSDPRAGLARKVAYALRRWPSPRLVREKIAARAHRGSACARLADALGARFTGRVHRVEHHLAHLVSASAPGPFGESVVVSVDGFGDFASAAWGVAGEDGTVRIDGRVHFPHSLGMFYETVTHHLGFRAYGDEYKVMGLAPYGEPAQAEAMRGIVRAGPHGHFTLDLDCFNHHRTPVPFQWDGTAPSSGDFFTGELVRRLGPARGPDEPIAQRHRDIARSAQLRYEEVFLGLLEALHERYRLAHLSLAGGCAFNSVANGLITARTPFEQVWVQPAAGDAGGALGAALVAHRRAGGAPRPFAMPHAYWGPGFEDPQCAAELDRHAGALDRAGCVRSVVTDPGERCERIAAAIDAGAVVGWFQGRMEWGPRALGNRSILCDPRRPDARDLLNERIKRRESFRPFAPSILRERVGEWFERDEDVPFMMKVFPVRVDKRALVPAVTHVDGSGRLHTVAADQNPLFHALLLAFERRTGVPLLLNTSFNENEPIVCRPSEALDCFLRTRMDVLVLGAHVVERVDGAHRIAGKSGA